MQRVAVLAGAVLVLGCQSPRASAPDASRAEIIASVFGGGAGQWLSLIHI